MSLKELYWSIPEMLLSLIRKILGAIILFLDRVFSPKSVERSSEAQMALDQKTKSLTLYQLEACPFCVKVRRQIKRLGLKIEIKNILENESFHQELLKGGGDDQVPCLRIQKTDGSVQWMYESSDINEYLTRLTSL